MIRFFKSLVERKTLPSNLLTVFALFLLALKPVSASLLSQEVVSLLKKHRFTTRQIEHIENRLLKNKIELLNVQKAIDWLKLQGVSDVTDFIEKYPLILANEVTATANQKVSWLQQQGVKNVGKVLSRNPNFLSYSISENLEPKMAWLKQLGITDGGAIIEAYPALFSLSLENNLNLLVSWLKNQGVQNVAKLVAKSPALLGLSIEENLAPKIKWLREQGVKDVGKLIDSFPALLNYSLAENFEPKVQWLKDQGFKDIGSIITKKPQIFGYSISDNLDLTLKELLQTWKYTLAEINYNPMLLSVSLQRIKLLAAELTAVGVDFNSMPLAFKSRLLMTMSAPDLLSRLKQLKAVSSTVTSLSQVNYVELQKVKELLNSSKRTSLVKPQLSANDQIECEEVLQKIEQSVLEELNLKKY